MSWGSVMTEFALIVMTVYFVMSLFVTNGTIVCFRLSSSFSGNEGFRGYVFNGFIRVVTEIDDGSSVCGQFLREYLFNRRGSSRGIGVSSFSLSSLFENDRGWQSVVKGGEMSNGDWFFGWNDECRKVCSDRF